MKETIPTPTKYNKLKKSVKAGVAGATLLLAASCGNPETEGPSQAVQIEVTDGSEASDATIQNPVIATEKTSEELTSDNLITITNEDCVAPGQSVDAFDGTVVVDLKDGTWKHLDEEGNLIHEADEYLNPEPHTEEEAVAYFCKTGE